MIARTLRALASRRRLARTVHELSSLCDASLDDIGVRRHDIARTARVACATAAFDDRDRRIPAGGRARVA